mgnify:CR=1 FL=1
MQLSGSAAFTAMPAGRPAVQRSADISMMAECVARNPPSCTLRAPRLPSHHITSHPAVSLSSRTRHVQNASRTHAHESLTHTPFHHLLLAFIPRSRTPFIAGNWKMNTVLSEAVSLAKEVAAAAEKADGVQVAVCPPFPFIVPVKEALKGSKVGVGAQDCYYEEAGAYTGALRASCCPSHPAAPPPPPPRARPELVSGVTSGATWRLLSLLPMNSTQHHHPFPSPFCPLAPRAAAVSTTMLDSVGCDYVLTGHSERRAVFGDSDADVNKKTLKVLDAGLKAILCIGELKEERESGEKKQQRPQTQAPPPPHTPPPPQHLPPSPRASDQPSTTTRHPDTPS